MYYIFSVMKPEKNLEIEIKLQLGSFTDYLKLNGHLGSMEQVQQHRNGFYDTADRELSRNGWALRVRSENDRGLVTVKGAATHSGAAVIRQELEAEIERSEAVRILGGYSDVLDMDVEPVRFIKQEFPGRQMVALLQFNNDRQCKRFRIGDYDYMLEIDRTEFTDGSVDYELEVELPDPGQIEVVEDGLRKMFSSLGIPFERQHRSKFERALERAGLFSS